MVLLQVRVPTHEEGSCLFWEFATDHYDIGFGVFFEWTISQTNRVSVLKFRVLIFLFTLSISVDINIY